MSSREKPSNAQALATELINALGLELMQDIADQIPKRPKGNPGRPRDDEFQRVCFRYLTAAGLKFDTAARQIHAERPPGGNITLAGFLNVMRKRLKEAEAADPKFLQSEAERISHEDLGDVRSDLFPAIAATQRLIRNARAVSDRLTVNWSKLFPQNDPLATISTRLQIPSILSEQQWADLCRRSAFEEAFRDLIPDDMPVDQLGGVYWLVRQLMEAWAKNNI